MARLRNYLERVHDIEATFAPQTSRLKTVSQKIFALVAAVENESWRVFPVVDSPEVAWDSPDLDRAVLEQELQEILDESESIS